MRGLNFVHGKMYVRHVEFIAIIIMWLSLVMAVTAMLLFHFKVQELEIKASTSSQLNFVILNAFFICDLVVFA